MITTLTEKSRKRADLDLSDLLPKKKQDLFSERPLASVIDVYVVGDIEEPENYIELFDKIRNAGEHDVIKLHINSCGGMLSTAIQFLRCLQESSARIVASVEGDCMSAATILLLTAHIYEISDHSAILCHHYRGGTSGRGNQMRDQMLFESRWSEKLFRDIYKDFLTDEEITLMIEGREIWLDADETKDRLQKRAEKRQAEEAAASKEKESED